MVKGTIETFGGENRCLGRCVSSLEGRLANHWHGGLVDAYTACVRL